MSGLRTGGRCAALACALAGSACSLMPAYERPPSPAALAYPGRTASAPESLRNAADLGWSQVFADPKLKRLIALALDSNRDLRIAALNIEASRAQYRIQSAELLPAVGLSADRSSQRVPGTPATGGRATVERSAAVSVGISAFELDFFGRIRSLQEQALQTFFATEQARRATHISLVGEVALNYLTLAADRDRLALARQTLDSQAAGYALSRRSYEMGTLSALTLRQQQVSVETARVDVARYTSFAAQDLNLLTLVVGAPLPDDALPAGLDDAVLAAGELPAGLPSDLLTRRPDILQAEHRLRGLNANIGAARAAFFPRITLTGSAGTASAGLDGLFKAGSGTWALGLPSITLPLFDGGANRAALEGARVERDIGVAEYERAIQTAFREVADALVQRDNVGDELAAQQALVEATRESFRLSEARFRVGVDSYLLVLDSQRSFYSAQQGLITTRLARIGNLATLYKVLGGGWVEG